MFPCAVPRQEACCWQQADDESQDEQAAKTPVSPARSEPKVASFLWASKLSAASSTSSSGTQPNLLQSLTGSLSGMQCSRA